MSTIDLGKREKLPDALRVLLEEYPRDAWDANPNFSDLIRFWLERHLMFRRLLAAMKSDLEQTLDGEMEQDTYAARLSRYGSHFLNDLHAHHRIEDMHYFPHLKGLDTRLSRGFDILDNDHHAIDGHLNDFAGAANDVIQGVASAAGDEDRVAAMAPVLVKTDLFLNRHLIDEEELVVPELLKFAPPGLT